MPARASIPQDDLTREQAALAEEQLLLHRQLIRLRETMVTLAARLEAEGRVHAAELLRAGIAHLDSRGGDTEAYTLEEWMERTREDIRAGRTHTALENQERILTNLASLLDILMDRQGLENLEEELEKLKQVRAALDQMADEEAKLRKDTEQLRADSANDAQRALEQGLDEALAEQRSILAASEQQARASGVFDLEAFRSRLEELIAAQAVSEEVFAGWDPLAQEQLRLLRTPLESARSAEADQARLEQGESQLLAAAEALEDGKPSEELNAAAERAEREARASGREAAQAVAQALAQAAASSQSASNEEQRQAAAAQARKAADDLARQASSAAQESAAAREQVRSLAKPLAEKDNAAGRTAERVQDALEEPENIQEALDELDRGTAAQSQTAQALEASQDQAATETRALGREAASAAERNQVENAEALASALNEAQESLEAAAEAARQGQAEAGRESAEQGQEALQRALAEITQALEKANDRADGAERSQLQERQDQLAEKIGQLGEQASQGSMKPSAQGEVQGSLSEAQESMQQASSQMGSNGSQSDAQKSQREAIDQLEQARSAAEEGIEPQTPEQKERAQEQAERQEAIKERLLELAKLNEERDSPLPQPNLAKAASSASEASESLQEGDLSQAQQQEEQTEQQIREALDDLEEEEEQYQRLRQEELLFRVAEEVQAMLEMLEEQMRATQEIDASREGRTSVSRSDRVRLRNTSREFEAIAQRASQVRGAIAKEGVAVFAEIVRNVEADLVRIARDMGEGGGYQSGERIQALQEDVHRNLIWLKDALEKELDDRQQEQEPPSPGGSGPQPPPPLVPDVAELKLLRMMEVEVIAKLKQQLQLHPELAGPTEDLDPLLLEDISRLAYQHNRISELFTLFRERLEIPAPPGRAPDGASDGSETDKPDAQGTNPGEEADDGR
jgi:colicin import membrane protein